METESLIESCLAIAHDWISDLFSKALQEMAITCVRHPQWFHFYRHHRKQRIRNKYKNKIVKEYIKSLKKR